MRLRAVPVLLLLGLVAVASLVVVSGGRERSVGRRLLCERVRSSRLAYGWPVRPFDRQHPVRGYFGDPRTVSSVGLGRDHSGSPGSFTFHNGVDISAPPGTPVYAVVSGIAKVASRDLVVVTTRDGRVFQYAHISPLVTTGETVVADRTVLGPVGRGRKWQHVHLAEIDHSRAHNPLDPGHLEPYRDATVPKVMNVTFTSRNGEALEATELSGDVLIAVSAIDVPPVPVPGHWFGFPVTPALVRWRMTSNTGTVIPETTIADFRHTEPKNRNFWRTYAAGAYENFPLFHHHFYWHHAGNYLFNLTPKALDTHRLRNGTYVVTIQVADTCGNHSSTIKHLQVENKPS
jgi:hypothetical protein